MFVQEITSIAVDPFHPYLFCTTSRDQTTRVYDLTLRARDRPKNVHWPPDKRPSLAGPAFGLQCSEAEGMGMGRCVAVLVGGRSGGHEAGVLGAVSCRLLTGMLFDCLIVLRHCRLFIRFIISWLHAV